MAFEDLFRKRFSNALPMSYYDPQFGEEELASVMAARQGLVGRTEMPVGPTGLYGRAIAAVGGREAARAVASGDLLSGARGLRLKARELAQVKRTQEDAAAESAGRLQQARLRGNIMAGIGEVGGSVGDLFSDPLFQKHLKGLAEQRDLASLPELRADLPRTKIGFSYSGNDVPTTGPGRLLERFSLEGLPSYDFGGF